MPNQSHKITIFLTDGEPDGIKTVELANRSCLGIVFPRNKLRNFNNSEDSKKSGIYFLFGRESEDSLIFSAYIGHANNIGDRLITHNNDDSKEFWQQTVVFVSQNDSLTPAHAKYLESRCVQLATQAKHFGYHLLNGNSPLPTNLPKADIPGMEDFLGNLNLLLATIGYPILQTIESKTKDDQGNPLFFCQNATNTKAKGTARMTNEGFVVYKGSTVAARYSGAIAKRNDKLLEQLLSENILKKDGDLFVFERDHNFIKPSAPADLILGYSVNGWGAWKTKEGKTLDEIYRG